MQGPTHAITSANTYWAKSRLEMALGLLVDKQLNMNQQCALTAQNANCVLHQKLRGQQSKGGDPAPLLLYCEKPPVVLCPDLETQR